MLEIIIVSIFVSTLLNLILKEFNIPTIIGYITTGVIIAYGFSLHSMANSHELKEIAEFGIVFLLFTIGLEFSVKNLIAMKRDVFLFGGLQVFLSAIIFSSLGYYIFDIELKSSIVIGLALALSSTAIVLKIINDSGDINKEYGHRVLGVLLFQDIAVIPILLMISIFSVNDKAISTLLMETLFDAFIVLLGLFIIGKYLLEPFLYRVSKTKSNEIFVSSILLIVMGASYLAHLFNFSYSLGAFIAGMMIAETHYKHQVEADLIPFRDLLLGIFFITVGMQLDFSIIVENVGTIIFLLFLITSVKVFVIYSLLSQETSTKVSLKSAVGLFQVGEFALVVFELASSKELLDPILSQVLIVTVVISMIMTPFVLKNITKIVDFILRVDTKSAPSIVCSSSLKNHIILIGYGRLGQSIAKLIKEQNIDFIAIDDNIKLVKDAQKNQESVIYGNGAQKSILNSLNIQDASSIIISIENNEKLELICQTVNELKGNAKTVVKVNKYEERDKFNELNIGHIIVGVEQTAQSMFNEVVKKDRED